MFSAITADGETLAFRAYTVDNYGNAKMADQFAIEKQKKEIKMGDVNLDGKIDSSDARLALRQSVNLGRKLQAAQKLAADIDFSERIEASDARLILRISVGLEEAEPESIYVYDSDLERVKF